MNEKISNIVALMVTMQAILPESKVNGTDMFGRKRPGKKGMADMLEKELKALAPDEKTWDMIQGLVDDKIQVILDEEDDLHRNQEVDDVQFRFIEAEVTARGDGDIQNIRGAEDLGEQGWEYKGARAEVARVYGVASDAVDRNNRLAFRLAIVAKLNSKEETKPLVAEVSDALVEQLMEAMKNKLVTEELKPFVVDKKMVMQQMRIINMKDHASYFRTYLEKKAEVMRTQSIICEDMMKGKLPMDRDYISGTIDSVKRVQQWCYRYFNGGKELKSMRRYSYRSICALYNECVDILHVLGVYSTTNYRMDKDSKEPYSFFYKKTREDMVQVKSGLHWAEELRTMVYETDDGTGRTAVRGSGD